MRVIAPALRVPVLPPCAAGLAVLVWLACTGCPGSVPDPEAFLVAGDDAGPTADASAMAACPDIPTMFTSACGSSGCHDDTTKAVQLDLRSPNVASRLVGVHAVGGPGLLIDTTTPSKSVIYTKLTPTPPFGLRMPSTVPLDDAAIQCVLAWVTMHATPAQPGQPAGDAGGPSGDGGAMGTDGGSSSPFAAIRVAAGQTSAVTDAKGNTWSADVDFTGGAAAVESTPVSIANTDTPALYNGQRYGNPSFSYQFTVPNGTYTLTLKFAELYVTGAGQREFGVSVNGTSVLTNFDIYATAGAMNTAVDKSFPVTVSGGTLQIDFTAGAVQNPTVDAIQITQGAPAGDAGI